MKTKIIFYFLVLLLTTCGKSNDVQITPDDSIDDSPTGKSTKQITVNGTVREYIIYVPVNYAGTTSLPLLFSFHGLTSTMENNFRKTKFNELAESENFILVHPQGISNQWTLNSVDNPDIDFIEALLNELEEDYNIESNRIYSTGMSNGGNFSFTLACDLSDRIAAIATVTGLFLQLPIGVCSPTRPVAILHIHGTEDPIATYALVQRGLDFWNEHNGTEMIPNINPIPDIDTGDGSTVERIEFLNGTDGVEVQHLKVIDGGHQWPGHKGNMDISASQEVWNFVKNYDLNGKIE